MNGTLTCRTILVDGNGQWMDGRLLEGQEHSMEVSEWRMTVPHLQ